MTVWGRTRNEMAGAWRSLRYDMGRRDSGVPGAPGGFRHARGRHAAGYDVTSAGLDTFGGPGAAGLPRAAYRVADPRRPRRIVAATAAGTLAVAGAAGSYLAVVHGLDALAGERGAEPYPLAAAAPGAPGKGLTNEGLGRGPRTGAQAVPGTLAQDELEGTIRVIPTTAATTALPAVARTTRAAVPPRAPRPATVEPTTPAAGPEPCDCLTPPVPTPTAVTPTSHSAEPEPSPTASAGETTDPAEEPTEEPSAGEPTDNEDGPRHHGRGNRARHAGRP